MENESLILCGKWRLEREVGRGAYGVVYLGVGADGERAAVKVCQRGVIPEERYVRELRGAKLYRAIPPQKEGLVRMRELVETDWGFYTVMDLADDEFADASVAVEAYRPKTLASVIESEKALPLAECVRLACALAKGLETLQRHHLLHRDIKPANVLYVGGKPVLSDPGLVVEESEAVSLVGTPGYVPPEKFTDAASDVYSLGLVLKAASFGRRVEDLAKGPAAEADTGAPQFAAWWRILNRATDPAPARRYQSAKALLKDVRRLRVKSTIARAFFADSKAAHLILLIALSIVFLFLLYVKVRIVMADVKEERRQRAAEKARREQYIQRETEKVRQTVENVKRNLDDTLKNLEADKKKREAELEEAMKK